MDLNSVLSRPKSKDSFLELPGGPVSGSTSQSFISSLTFLLIFAVLAQPSSLRLKLSNHTMLSFVQKVSTVIAKHLLGILEELSHKGTGCDIFLVVGFLFRKT